MSPSRAQVIAFAGSARADSFNKKLVTIAAEGARGAGAHVDLIDLKDFTLPIYDGDVEAQEGMPENALKLRSRIGAADGILISSPEFNGSVSALLKNVIDWVSRPVAGEPSAFAGKVCAIMSTSPGALGGIRGLNHLRLILTYQNVVVLPEQLAVGRASEAFDGAGKLKNADQHASILFLGSRVAQAAAALRPVISKF